MSKKQFWIPILVFFLTLLLPLLTDGPNFLCKETNKGRLDCKGFEFDPGILVFLQFSVIVVILLFYGYTQYQLIYRPSIKFTEARKYIFDAFIPMIVGEEQASIRINIMKSKKKFFGLFSKLEPMYRYGFLSKHRDYHLIFWCSKPFNWAQGNSGLAYINEKPKFADLTIQNPEEYNLSKKKKAKTEDIKGIISLPVFEVPNENSTPRTIGVINIDTGDEEIVKKWREDEQYLDKVINESEELVQLASYLIF